MTALYYLLLLFCLSLIYPTLLPYRYYWKGRFWWSKAWTPHALAICSMSIFLNLLNRTQTILDLLSGVLMVVSGVGLIFIFLIFLIENQRLLFPPIRRSLIIILIHLLMGSIGFWFLFNARVNSVELFLIFFLLAIYALIIFPKGLNVPFILYEKSNVPLNFRKWVLRCLTGAAFVLLPLLRSQP